MIRTLNPSGWPRPRGYNHGVAARGDLVFLAGLVGWNEQEVFECDATLLAEAGGGPEHMVRMTWYVLDKAEYLSSLTALGEAYRAVLGRHFPAMSVVQVTGLIEPGARLEIEITAVLPPAENV